MSKSAIAWIIVGASLVLLGAIIFGGVMMSIKWDFKKLSTVRYETNRYEISENYKNISIDTSTADIVFLPSTDGVTAVVCYEQINEKHAVSVKDNTVCIEIANTKKWYEYVGVTFVASAFQCSSSSSSRSICNSNLRYCVKYRFFSLFVTPLYLP